MRLRSIQLALLLPAKAHFAASGLCGTTLGLMAIAVLTSSNVVRSLGPSPETTTLGGGSPRRVPERTAEAQEGVAPGQGDDPTVGAGGASPVGTLLECTNRFITSPRGLNNRPRKTLGYMKPSEKLAEVLADTG